MQRQMERLAEQQTIGLTAEVRDQIEQISRQTEEGLQQIKQIAASEADQVEDFVRSTQAQNDERPRPHAEGRDHPGAGNESAAGMADEQRQSGEGEITANGAQSPTWESDDDEADATGNARPNRETRRKGERSRARR
jgi:hypothetical protein